MATCATHSFGRLITPALKTSRTIQRRSLPTIAVPLASRLSANVSRRESEIVAHARGKPLQKPDWLGTAGRFASRANLAGSSRVAAEQSTVAGPPAKITCAGSNRSGAEAWRRRALSRQSYVRQIVPSAMVSSSSKNRTHRWVWASAKALFRCVAAPLRKLDTTPRSGRRKRQHQLGRGSRPQRSS